MTQKLLLFLVSFYLIGCTCDLKGDPISDISDAGDEQDVDSAFDGDSSVDASVINDDMQNSDGDSSPDMTTTDEDTSDMTDPPSSDDTEEGNAKIVISEFRFRGPEGANDEFIEIENIGTNEINISGWKIVGSNAEGKTSTRATITDEIILAAGDHFLFANSKFSGASDTVIINKKFTTSIADDGAVAIYDDEDNLIDSVGMSTTCAFYETTVLTPLTSDVDQSYVRLRDSYDYAIDTDNNFDDFSVVSPSMPQSKN